MKNSMFKSFSRLRLILDSVSSLNEVEPLIYLSPFLDVIRSEGTTGPITGLALTAVDKFLSYGLLELPNNRYHDSAHESNKPSCPVSIEAIARAAEAIADSGTQARFVGTDRGSDEVVLMKVLHLLRTLLLVPAGRLVSDRVVREILQSCFRICFEQKLSELLRRTAELCLASIIQLFFSRLPYLLQSANCLETGTNPSQTWKTQAVVTENQSDEIECTHTSETLAAMQSDSRHQESSEVPPAMAETLNDLSVDVNPGSSQNNETMHNSVPLSSEADVVSTAVQETENLPITELSDSGGQTSNHASIELDPGRTVQDQMPLDASADQKATANESENEGPNKNPPPQSYGLPAVHDLLHYLIGLLTPEQNSDPIIATSLSLVTIALETGADAIASCPSLLQLVQGDLSKHLMLLLYSDRVWQFAATLRVCFMLFESMRRHLKLQMEVYLQRLTAICSLDNELTSYERREIALESFVRLFLVPGLATELYVNYDCDPYCANLFEEITKMLAKNAYPVERLMSTHLLSLDALLAVLNSIGTVPQDEVNPTGPAPPPAPLPLSGESDGTVAASQMTKSSNALPTDTQSCPDSSPDNGTQRACKIRTNRHQVDRAKLPSREQLLEARRVKKILMLGSDQFNIKPKQGIALLQQYGLLRDPLEPNELAVFLRENPRLDKRMIGECLSDRKSDAILAAYVRQFNFVNVPIDEALRVYLEAFRLPGEAPLIQRVMEHFAEHWFLANNAPFTDVDSAFTLAYAILMLNTDQHNPNSKKQNVPMKSVDFTKNLSETPQADFVHASTGCLDADLFDLIWGPTVSALSFIFDKTIDPAVQTKAVHGFIRCAAIAAQHGLCDVLDNLVISLCKFTTLLTSGESSTSLPVSLGRNAKARLALRLVFALTANHADILRYGWHSLLDCMLQLFRANLIPDELTEAEDYLAPSRRVRLTTRGCIAIAGRKSLSANGERKRARGSNQTSGGQVAGREVSVFSSFYQYLTSGSPWGESESDDEDGEAQDDDDVVDSASSSTGPSIGQSGGLSVEKKTPTFNVIGIEDAEAIMYQVASSSWLTDPTRSNASSSTVNHQKGQQGIEDQLTADYWVGTVRSAQLDEQRASRVATDTVRQCEMAQLIRDSKFLVDASLTELCKVLLRAIRADDFQGSSIPHPLVPNPYSPTTNPSGGNRDHAATTISSPRCVDASTSVTHLDSPPEHFHRPGSTPPPTAALTRSMTMPTCVTSNSPTPTTAAAAAAAATAASISNYYPAFSSSAAGGGGMPTEECRIFCLELLLRILLYNRDRITQLWPFVQGHLVELLLTAARPNALIERVIVGLLRLAATCLLRRHEMTSQIFACLHYILLTRGDQLLGCDHTPLDSKPARPTSGRAARQTGTQPAFKSRDPNRVGLQLIAGLTQLLHNHAGDLPDPATDWQLVFSLLEVCGAGLRSQPSPSRRERRRHHHHPSNQQQQTHHFSTHDLSSHNSEDPSRMQQLARGCTSDGEVSLNDGSDPTRHHDPSAPSKLTRCESMPPPATPPLPTKTSSDNAAWVMVDVNRAVSPSPPCISQLAGESSEGASASSLPRVVDVRRVASGTVYPAPFPPPPPHGDISTTVPVATAVVSVEPTLEDRPPNELIPSRVLALLIHIGATDAATLKQAAECLDFLIRDPAHISPDNFEYCVRTLRVFVEACLRRQPQWSERSIASRVAAGKTSPHTTANGATPTRRNANHRTSGQSRKHHPTGATHATYCNSSGSDCSSSSGGEEEALAAASLTGQLGSSTRSLTSSWERRNQRARWIKEVHLSPTTSLVATQLLDLINLLFTRASSIHMEWTRLPPSSVTANTTGPSGYPPPPPNSTTEQQQQDITSLLWQSCWRPLLQATARLCCDSRREVRTDALAYLQRALLSPILQSLSGSQWEDCFDKVLFPLLSGLLESIALDEALAANAQADMLASGRRSHTGAGGGGGGGGPNAAASMHFHTVEFIDPRMRAIPLLTKVFLQHLRPLHQSQRFHMLWLRILTYMEQYMQASSSDSLTDAVRESLKNVLLVMFTGTHDTPPILLRSTLADSPESVLWTLTSDRLAPFLPTLLDQLFPPPPVPVSAVQDVTSTVPVASATPLCAQINSNEMPTECASLPPTVAPSPQSSINTTTCDTASSSVVAQFPPPPVDQPQTAQPATLSAVVTHSPTVQDL